MLTLATCLAITRNSERGTMGNLLSMPLRPTGLMGIIVLFIGVKRYRQTLD